ncbi:MULTISPECIES: carbohydrate ABC transporter permease [Streptomyces]|uniref:carbohydrate ABC transporter permease n=1 Tax=Streptomyces TaxID=1883 RepID=UPI001E4759EA|nr:MULTISPECIES: carbohydrate ABC transporter permease [Streptomyces]UFQ13801.1 carbohydrate ABC transporter permease [Streptomyces huasconensis]WCL83397.1 carbohydrate ABC transporter permease [Streptomyces sp. JCM 35825]
MGRLTRNVLVAGCVVLWLIPLYLLVVNALTPATEYAGRPGWTVQGFALGENLRTAWDVAGIGDSFQASLLYSVVCGLAAVLVAAMAAFAVVVLPIPRPAFWFWLIYSGTLFPLQIFLAPLFGLYADAGLYDTRIGLMLVYTAWAVPFAFFLIRNQMATMPPELTEAALLDGASFRRVFWHVHVPLMRAGLGAAFIFQFTAVWNDLLLGITLSRSPDVQPVMAALTTLNNAYASTGPPVVLVGALIVSAPTLALFLVFRGLFLRGVTASAR